MSRCRYDYPKYDYLINTHFQFNEYSWLTIALSGSTDEGRKINRLLLLHRVFFVPRFGARSPNSFIVISAFSFSFVNSKRLCKFFACDILVSTDIRIAQATFKSSKLALLLFSTERSVIMIMLEIKWCHCMRVCSLIKCLKYSWPTHDMRPHASWCNWLCHG